MADVAARAGVSIKTVSRVLNGEPHVHPDMRAKVQRAVDALGYVPSAAARSLRSRRTYSILLVAQAVPTSYGSAVQFGVLQACQRAGYHMRSSMLTEETLADEALLRVWRDTILQRGAPDGVVLQPPMSNHAGLAAILAEMEVRVVRIGPNRVPAQPGDLTLRIDDRAAARAVTEHLLTLGHRRVAFLRGKEAQDATAERHAGFSGAMEAAGLGEGGALVLQGDFEFESGLAAGERLTATGGAERPSAVFAANDAMAAGVMIAAHRAGLDLPGDLSVAGFDDDDIASKTWPPLTTVRQPILEMARLAAETLAMSAGQAEAAGLTGERVFEHELILRASTAPPGRAPSITAR